jgi:hypothetical protein
MLDEKKRKRRVVVVDVKRCGRCGDDGRGSHGATAGAAMTVSFVGMAGGRRWITA